MNIEKTYLSLRDVDVAGKRVIVREDFNVPIQNGVISSSARLIAALPTLRYLLEQNARILILSHLGRPPNAQFCKEFSLAPVATALSELLKQNVTVLSDWLDRDAALEPGQIALAENVRFLPGEQENELQLAANMAARCDVFVMDAFGCAHRANASTEGIARYAPIACMGLLMETEITALHHAFAKPQHPLLAIIGGSKVSTKLHVLEKLLTKVDTLILGGGIANTFLAAQGFELGQSLWEPDFLTHAQHLLHAAAQTHKNIPLPIDVIVSTGNLNDPDITGQLKSVTQLSAQDKILDIGPKTQEIYRNAIATAQTIIWNGPVGVFEIPAFAKGTEAIAHAVAHSHAYTLAGGGDTVAALEQFNVAPHISYISTGGGAFIEFLEGKVLPSLAILQQRAHLSH